MENNTRKYLLVIKRDNNDYLPLEWFNTEYYNGENLNSLDGIDSFTSHISHVDLLQSCLDLGYIDLDDKYLDFAIIFYENGKWREIKEGCLFSNTQSISETELVDLVIKFADDKVVINNITNIFNKGFNSEEAKQLFMILKNIGSFAVNGEEYLRMALDVYYRMPYEEKRRLRIQVSDMLMTRIKKGQMIYTKNSDIM